MRLNLNNHLHPLERLRFMLRSTLAPLPVTLLLAAPAAFGADAPVQPAPSAQPASQTSKPEAKPGNKKPEAGKPETKKPEELDAVTVQGHVEKELSLPKYVKPLV